MLDVRGPSGEATSPINFKLSLVRIVMGRRLAGKTVLDLIGAITELSLVLCHERDRITINL